MLTGFLPAASSFHPPLATEVRDGVYRESTLHEPCPGRYPSCARFLGLLTNRSRGRRLPRGGCALTRAGHGLAATRTAAYLLVKAFRIQQVQGCTVLFPAPGGARGKTVLRSVSECFSAE